MSSAKISGRYGTVRYLGITATIYSRLEEQMLAARVIATVAFKSKSEADYPMDLSVNQQMDRSENTEAQIPANKIGAVDAKRTEEQLQRILASDEFSSSPRLCVFLKYVVAETIAGRGSDLKAYTIATNAYGKPASFKTRDPYIRNIARAVRSAIQKYYLKEGLIDSVVIDIPTGRYEPRISYQSAKPVEENVLLPKTTAAHTQPAPNNKLKPTIGVIPFAIQGEQKENPIGEILADSIITGISVSNELNVISRLSTTIFRNRDISTASIGTHLNADYLVCGSYTLNGKKLSLNVELCTAKDGLVVWADRLERTMDNIQFLEFELAEELIDKISDHIIGNEIKRALTGTASSLETYSLMISAIRLIHRESRNDFARARKMLQTVIERHASSSAPYAWLAKWHVLEFNRGWNTNQQAVAENAIWCTQRALDMDSHCSLALTIDGFVHTNILKDLETGNDRYEQALTLNPNESLAWLLKGTLNAFKGAGEIALDETNKARHLSPLDPLKYYYESLSATAALAAEKYELAIELAKSSLRINRMHTSTLRALAIAQSELGQMDDAKVTISRILKLDPTLTVRNYLERSPSRDYQIGEKWSKALGRAGLPN